MEPILLADAVDRAMARAALLRFFSAAWRVPGVAQAADLERRIDELNGILTVLGVEELQAGALQAAEHSCAALQRQYAEVLGHTVRAAATPYETEWTGWAGQPQQFHQISDIGAFYRAFGLEMQDCGERADHVSVQLEFLAFLALKEAYAGEQGDAELAAVSTDGARKFMAEHFMRWAPSFCRRVRRIAGSGFYPALAELMEHFLRAEARRLGGLDTELDLPFPAVDPELTDACFSCAASSSCAEATRGP